MPDITQMTTAQLLSMIETYVAPAGQSILTELNYREIKEDDEDDTEFHRGGIRPTHAPIVP